MQLTLASQDSGLARIRSDGPITQQTTTPKSEPIRDLLGADAYSRRVLWDLSASDYIDSSGVGLLVQSHKRFKEGGGMLVFHSAGSLAMKVLKLLRMDLYLHLVRGETEAAALAEKGKR